MPTGYTAKIKDGIEFKEFALDCARAFGACIELRDEGGGGELIPDEFQPSSYSKEAADRAREQLKSIIAMTDEEKENAAICAYEEAEDARIKALSEKAELRVKYEEMLDSVLKWKIPTVEHRGLRDFMIEQIKTSIDFDCGGDYYKTPTQKIGADEWFSGEVDRLEESIRRHEENYVEEVERAKARSEWVMALKESLS